MILGTKVHSNGCARYVVGENIGKNTAKTDN